MAAQRRFPPPWRVVELPGGYLQLGSIASPSSVRGPLFPVPYVATSPPAASNRRIAFVPDTRQEEIMKRCVMRIQPLLFIAPAAVTSIQLPRSWLLRIEPHP